MAAETKVVSSAEGGRYTPRSRAAWKKRAYPARSVASAVRSWRESDPGEEEPQHGPYALHGEPVDPFFLRQSEDPRFERGGGALEPAVQLRESARPAFPSPRPSRAGARTGYSAWSTGPIGASISITFRLPP